MGRLYLLLLCFVLSCSDLHSLVCIPIFWVLSNNFCSKRSTLLGKKCDPAFGGGGGGGVLKKKFFFWWGVPSISLSVVASASTSSAASSSAASCVGVWAVLVAFSLGWVVLRIEYLLVLGGLGRYGCTEAFA